MAVHAGQVTAAPAEWDAFLVANPDLAEVDVFIIDVNGLGLGKRLKVADVRAVYTSGLQYSACAPVLDCRGHGQDALGIGGSDGDPDASAFPLPGNLHRVPWARLPTAQVLCTMRDVAAGRPLWFDPREILAGVVERCRSDGIHPVVACEHEFYLVDPKRVADGRVALAALRPGAEPPRRAANLSIDAVESAAEFLRAVNTAAAAQSLPVCGSVAEYGIGQYEINLQHVADPLRAADHAVLLKRVVRGVARALGMEATFMAKPFTDQAGSGLHVHTSVVDERGNNRFGSDGGETLLGAAIAGLQTLMFDSTALFAPNFNSYRRYLGPFVPTTRDWGYNNRSVAFRVPVAKGAGRRVEHRVAGADASPHLAVAAILAGLHLGMTERLTPTAPVEGRIQGDLDGGGGLGFPSSLHDALNRLEHSELLARYLPPKFLRLYAELKRGEYAELIEPIFVREYDFYL